MHPGSLYSPRSGLAVRWDLPCLRALGVAELRGPPAIPLSFPSAAMIAVATWIAGAPDCFFAPSHQRRPALPFRGFPQPPRSNRGVFDIPRAGLSPRSPDAVYIGWSRASATNALVASRFRPSPLVLFPSMAAADFMSHPLPFFNREDSFACPQIAPVATSLSPP